jgi:hypothetical protein
VLRRFPGERRLCENRTLGEERSQETS